MGRRYAYDDDDDEDEEVRPRRRTRPKQKARKRSPLLWVGLGIALLVIVTSLVVGAVVFRDRFTGLPSASNDATLVGHWSFEEAPAGRIADKSKRGNDLFLYGGRPGEGKRGQGLWLDGRPEQYCEIPDGPDFNFAPRAEFTIAGWYRSIDGSGTIVSLRHSALPTQVEVLIRNGRLQGIVGDDTDLAMQAIIWGRPSADGQWHHFALVRNPGYVELFQDGVLLGTKNDGGSGQITTDIRAIGCERRWVRDNDLRWGRPGFNGSIDEIYIYRRALTEGEIVKLMQR
jgi:hypothetical protein